MKNQYKIILIKNNTTLYYNEDFNMFSVKHGTIYTNKKKAIEKMQFAKKYGTDENNSKIKIIKLQEVR